MHIKEEYIKMRNSGKYNINWFYKYFDKPIGIDNFAHIFNMGDLNLILEHLDKEFNLTTIIDSNGKFIKVCE